jgi:hypothetical protein
MIIKRPKLTGGRHPGFTRFNILAGRRTHMRIALVTLLCTLVLRARLIKSGKAAIFTHLPSAVPYKSAPRQTLLVIGASSLNSSIGQPQLV